MPYQMEKIDDEPIVVITYENPMSVPDVEASLDELADYHDDNELRYVIADTSRIDNWGFADMVAAMAYGRGDGPGKLGDPMMPRVFVGTNEMVRLSAEASKQEQYGKVTIPMFTDVDEALEYVRGVLVAS